MIINKEEFLKTLTDEQLNAGYLKFDIPDEDDATYNGECVWGWAAPEEKEKYNDLTYKGKITAILLNQPIEYYGRLNWADEVVLKCRGDNKPVLDSEWIKENLTR